MMQFRRKCKTPGCPNLHRNASGYCDDCQIKRQAESRYRMIMAGTDGPEAQREREKTAARGYDSRWAAFARRYLTEHPVCALCGAPARVVDHKDIPAQVMLDMWGRFDLDPEHYQALCYRCNSRKAKEDRKKTDKYFELQKRLDAGPAAPGGGVETSSEAMTQDAPGISHTLKKKE